MAAWSAAMQGATLTVDFTTLYVAFRIRNVMNKNQAFLNKYLAELPLLMPVTTFLHISGPISSQLLLEPLINQQQRITVPFRASVEQ